MKNVRWMTLGGFALVASLTVAGCTKKEEPVEAPAVEEAAPAEAPAPSTDAAAPATDAAPATAPTAP